MTLVFFDSGLHLILLQTSYPLMSGIMMSRIMRSGLKWLTCSPASNPSLADIPVVILTTSDSEQDMARAYERHANSYLVKPVDHVRFGQLVASIESYWLELNRQPVVIGAS